MAQRYRFGFTGGGTAGHVTPSFAIMELMRADGHELVYFGTADGIERELVARQPDVSYVEIPSERLRRYADVRNLVAPLRVTRGVALASWRVRQAAPDVLFSKGGFVAFPAVVGAWLNRIPVVVHESDMTSGLANKMSFPFAHTICTGFEQTARELARSNVLYTGSPVRAAITTATPEAARSHFSLDPARPLIVFFGGSQGAQHLNEVVWASLDPLLARAQIVHLCGKGKRSEAHDSRDGYHQLEYLHELFPSLLKAADVVVARAGANSIAELLAMRKPALLIPLPLASSRGDQLANARDFAARGYGELVRDEDLSTEALLNALDKLLEAPARYIERQASSPDQGAAELIYTHLLSLAAERRR